MGTGASNLTINPFRFVGQVGYYLDADTGNYYVRARAYQPAISRWSSTDPLGILLNRVPTLTDFAARLYSSDERIFGVPSAPRPPLMMPKAPMPWFAVDRGSYFYCDNSPTARIDASGLKWVQGAEGSWWWYKLVGGVWVTWQVLPDGSYTGMYTYAGGAAGWIPPNPRSLVPLPGPDSGGPEEPVIPPVIGRGGKLEPRTVTWQPKTLNCHPNDSVYFSCSCRYKPVASGGFDEPTISYFSRFERLPTCEPNMIYEFFYCICRYPDGTEEVFKADPNTAELA